MGYEVRMYYENYYSGVLVNALVYHKLFGDLKDAVKKFDGLKKQISDIDEWKKIRGRVKELELAELNPKDFEDGYCFFDGLANEKEMYVCSKTLNLAYGFDYEELQVQIVDPETNEPIRR